MKLDETRAGRPLSHAAVAAQWFAQDLFAAAEAEDDEEPPPQAARQPRARSGERPWSLNPEHDFNGVFRP